MSNRVTLKITLSDGDFWYSGFNGTIQEANEYFMGRRFEALSPYTMKEYMRKPVVKVEIV
jgi:hypothetical protein